MTTEIRSVQYRLLPCTVAKAKALSRLAGACRWVWNEMLDQQNQIHELHRMYGVEGNQYPSFFTLGKAFTQLRKTTPWLQELPYGIVRYTLKYQADAWKAFFKKQGGHPMFKGRHGDDGFTIPEDIRIYHDRIWIRKLGWYVLRRRGGNPYPEGTPKLARIQRINGKWYCTVAYEVAIPEQEDNGLTIGVDRNVGQVATSTGHIIPMPDVSRLESRKRRYQRMMARRQKGSNRRNKVKHLVSKTSRKMAQVRKDWNHQTSRILTNTASEVILEDLNTKGVTRSAKGTLENPGTHVKAKSGLNREILKTGWHQLESMLGYKAHTLTRVPAHHTSQACHQCGLIDASNRKSQSKFKCSQCGHESNADINAALNIMALGTGASGRRGAITLVTPGTRQKIGDEGPDPPVAVGYV